MVDMSALPKPYKLLPTPIEASTWSNRVSNVARPAARSLDRDSLWSERRAPGIECPELSTASRSGPGRPLPTVPARKARFAPEALHAPCNPTTEEPCDKERAPRKFVPQLVESSSRTRKRSDASRRLGREDRTDAVSDQEAQNASAELRSQRIIYPGHRQRHSQDRHSHSFRMPDLDTIVSSESGGSSSSLSSSVQRQASRDHFVARLADEHDQYMLELEARRMSLKLQEQALAAFANSDYHEPVEHYVNLDEDTNDAHPSPWEDEKLITTTRPFKREDTLKVNWDLLELRQYHETLEQERNFMKTTAKRRSADSDRVPLWRTRNASASSQADIARNKKTARPPMLGQDIVFPRSVSPEPARFDVTQGTHLLRSSTCYLTEQLEASARQLISPEGMWGGLAKPARKTSSQSGLWGGLCAGEEAPPNTGVNTPSGQGAESEVLQSFTVDLREDLPTPGEDIPRNPLEHDTRHLAVPAKMRRLASAPDRIQATTSLSPETSVNIDRVMSNESELDDLIEAEFPDTFVTQVFNYLSLGYPSLARPFDSELSMITQVPVSELRSDDELAASMSRGYIRLGPDFESEGVAPKAFDFSRWRALKLYIRDWARTDLERSRERKKSFESTGTAADGLPSRNSQLLSAGEHYGTAPRRGSWAW